MRTLSLTAPKRQQNVPEGDYAITVLYHMKVNPLSKRVTCVNTHCVNRKNYN